MSTAKSSLQVDTDEFVVALPANFAVWLASKEGAFTRGKFVYCNYDVDELKSKADEIVSTPALTANIVGWPWA